MSTHTPEPFVFDERVACAAIYPASQTPENGWANGLHPEDHGRDILVWMSDPTEKQRKWGRNAVACVNALADRDPSKLAELEKAAECAIACLSAIGGTRPADNLAAALAAFRKEIQG